MNTQLLHGDCLDRLKELPDCSVDAVVTDPPYGLSFMGKKWDYDVPSEDIWRECLRVLKPGGHLLAFAGTRTQHRMCVRIEDAGFEIRDMIAWVYGSGFPKSLDVSKAIDKAAGSIGESGPMKRGGERLARLVDGKRDGEGRWGNETGRDPYTYLAATDAARQWQGWGTALKPALEPITVARKPLVGTVAANVLEHGTGAINVDGCRVSGEGYSSGGKNKSIAFGATLDNQERCDGSKGRWPANLIHDGSDEVVGLFPQAGGGTFKRNSDTGRVAVSTRAYNPRNANQTDSVCNYGDSGSAARFFYVAKASKRDRDEGCEGLEERIVHQSGGRKVNTSKGNGTEMREFRPSRNHHPTVKPTALMRYLCRLVTPPGGVVLDPFMGSGSTGKAAILEGFCFIGIEREAEYLEIARARIEHAAKSGDQQLDMPGMV